jgi:hypothetical protein
MTGASSASPSVNHAAKKNILQKAKAFAMNAGQNGAALNGSEENENKWLRASLAYSSYLRHALKINYIPLHIPCLALTCIAAKREHWHDRVVRFLLSKLGVSLRCFGRQRNGLTARYANDTTILMSFGNHWNLVRTAEETSLYAFGLWVSTEASAFSTISRNTSSARCRRYWEFVRFRHASQPGVTIPSTIIGN